MTNSDSGSHVTSKTPRERGETFERTAFTLCKIATFSLLFGRYALPLAATGAAIFFLLADRFGKHDTRCIGKHPRLIAAFWLGVAGMWVWWNFYGSQLPHLHWPMISKAESKSR